MNNTSIDWRFLLIVVLVMVFLVSPLINLIYRVAFIQPLPVVLALGGAAWFISSAIKPWRRGGVAGSTRVTYWRGERIEMRAPARSRVRAVTGTQMAVAAIYLVLGVAAAFAAFIYLQSFIALF